MASIMSPKKKKVIHYQANCIICNSSTQNCQAPDGTLAQSLLTYSQPCFQNINDHGFLRRKIGTSWIFADRNLEPVTLVASATHQNQQSNDHPETTKTFYIKSFRYFTIAFPVKPLVVRAGVPMRMPTELLICITYNSTFRSYKKNFEQKMREKGKILNSSSSHNNTKPYSPVLNFYWSCQAVL